MVKCCVPLMHHSSFIRFHIAQFTESSLVSNVHLLIHFLFKVLTAKEFSDGFNIAAADLIFQFATSLICSCHTEVVTLYELVVRVLMARLESKPSSGKGWERVSSALDLLKTLVEETNMAALSGPEKGILKFQVEQVSIQLPSVNVEVLYNKTLSRCCLV